MQEPKGTTDQTRTQGLLANEKTRLIIFVLALAMLFVSIALVIRYINTYQVSAQEFVDLQQGDTVYAGFRRAHAKGICLQGEFDSNGALAKYSTASIFGAQKTPLVGRFSVAGNNPTAPDLKAPVRSLAFSISLPNNQEWRVAMNTPPVMAVKNPQDFFEQLSALQPDPVTKKSDPQKIKDFFAAHPESATFLAWKDRYTPSNSFANEQYHSINAFYLIDDNGTKQAVRWQVEPMSIDVESLAISENQDDALLEDIMLRLDRQPVLFNLVFSLASDNDDETDPTTLWPDTRPRISAGTLRLSQYTSQADGECNGINYDPLVLPDGMAATEDKILRARSGAYAESYRRRAKEVLLGRDVANRQALQPKAVGDNNE